MAYTEKEMNAQKEQLAALEDELSRMVTKQDGLMKALGIDAADLAVPGQIPPELQVLMKQEEEAAHRAGQARAAQSGSAPCTASGGMPGAGRRGIIRL